MGKVITILESCSFPDHQWKNLGIRLGIIKTQLDSISADRKHIANDCLRECLACWLQQSYDTDKYDLPTVKSLAKAVKEMGLRAVSSRILESFPKGIINEFCTDNFNVPIALHLQPNEPMKEVTYMEFDASQILEQLHEAFTVLEMNVRKHLADHIKNHKIELTNVAGLAERHLDVRGLTDVVSIDKLFSRIQDHYYCLNCSVLELVVINFLTEKDDKTVKDKMTCYLRNLEHFKSTKLNDLHLALIKVLPSSYNRAISATTSQVALKLIGLWERQTFKIFDRFIKQIFEKDHLFNHIHITEGCICVTYLIPLSYTKYLIDVATPKIKPMYRLGVFQLVISGCLILDEKDNVNILIEAVKSGDTFEVSILLSLGANLYYEDANGDSPIFLAVLRGNEEVKELLIQKDDAKGLELLCYSQ